MLIEKIIILTIVHNIVRHWPCIVQYCVHFIYITCSTVFLQYSIVGITEHVSFIVMQVKLLFIIFCFVPAACIVILVKVF